MNDNRSTLRNLMNPDPASVEKNLPFLLFLVSLTMIYIWNTHRAESVVRQINTSNKELKELRWEYMSKKSNLMFSTKQSQVAREVEKIGLKELRTPPYIIVENK